jgi:hypothetical protein
MAATAAVGVQNINIVAEVSVNGIFHCAAPPPSASSLLPCSGTQNAIDVHNKENTSIHPSDGIRDATSNWVRENEDRTT